VKVTIEMTLDEETAQRIKEAAKHIAVMDFSDGNTLLAASILERIANDYARKVEALTVEGQSSDVQTDLLPGPK
jgi:hypothetical protein